MFVHILPNSLTPIIVQMTLGVGRRDSLCRGVGLFGAGCAAAHAGMGRDDRRWLAALEPVAQSGLLSRHGDYGHGVGL